jgi:hypothetical protein
MLTLRPRIVAGALIVAAIFAAPVTAGAQMPPPPDPGELPPPPDDGTPTDPGEPPPLVQTFSDVPSTDTHFVAIELMAALGWANGYSDGTYRPTVAVARGQMATFLTRALSLSLSNSPSPFSDTAGSVHERSIVAVADAGIALGYPDGSFGLWNSVTRGQMASFLARAFALPAAPTSSSFTDIAGNTHETAIRAVEQAGIAMGYSDGTFRPGSPVTRAQMATFLVRAAMAL